MRILVVDDSKAMRMIVCRALRASARFGGAQIEEATDGADALARVGAAHPDAILSDWNMPNMTGIQLLETLRGQGDLVPVGFVTSESTPDMYAQAMRAGASFLVSKPFTPESLEAALAQVL